MFVDVCERFSGQQYRTKKIQIHKGMRLRNMWIRNQDLSKIKFSRVFFDEVYFENCILKKSNFDFCHFSGKFINCDLTGASFNRAYISFSDAGLEKKEIEIYNHKDFNFSSNHHFNKFSLIIINENFVYSPPHNRGETNNYLVTTVKQLSKHIYYKFLNGWQAYSVLNFKNEENYISPWVNATGIDSSKKIYKIIKEQMK